MPVRWLLNCRSYHPATALSTRRRTPEKALRLQGLSPPWDPLLLCSQEHGKAAGGLDNRIDAGNINDITSDPIQDRMGQRLEKVTALQPLACFIGLAAQVTCFLTLLPGAFAHSAISIQL